MADKEHFCEESLKPWITVLIVFVVLTVVWIVMKKEEIMAPGEREAEGAGPAAIAPPQGEPVFPSALKTAGLPNPYSARKFDIAAITKATPRGGIQLVANPSLTGFKID